MSKELVAQIMGDDLNPNVDYIMDLHFVLERWYGYSQTEGHCIVCCPESKYQEDVNLDDKLQPVPARYVLRNGYKIDRERGYVVVTVPILANGKVYVRDIEKQY